MTPRSDHREYRADHGARARGDRRTGLAGGLRGTTGELRAWRLARGTRPASRDSRERPPPPASSVCGTGSEPGALPTELRGDEERANAWSPRWESNPRLPGCTRAVVRPAPASAPGRRRASGRRPEKQQRCSPRRRAPLMLPVGTPALVFRAASRESNPRCQRGELHPDADDGWPARRALAMSRSETLRKPRSTCGLEAPRARGDATFSAAHILARRAGSTARPDDARGSSSKAGLDACGPRAARKR